MASSDKIRIVVPAYNAGETIQKCVEAILEATSALNACEIIIVDDGKNIDLENALYRYNIKILKSLQNGSAAYARNQGANNFDVGIIVFIDSDVICDKNCITNLIAPLQKKLCQATIGNYSDNLSGLNFAQKYKQLYIKHIYDRPNPVIKNDFWTAISAVDAKVFHSVSGFNTNFKGANGEDQEFGIRLTKNSYKVLSVADAVGQHINPYTISKIIRNDFRKGVTAVLNSLQNNVALTDNRHANSVDIFSVAMAVLSLFFIAPGIFFYDEFICCHHFRCFLVLFKIQTGAGFLP